MTHTEQQLRKKPVVLLILDGFGHREEEADNAISLANMPNWLQLKSQYAYGIIDASERMVGLPIGQFGNSEVGHLNIGAGRVVEQDITRIDLAIEQNSLKDNRVLQETLQYGKQNRLHVMGLFSDGGVHSHIEHFFAVLDLAIKDGVEKIIVHPFLDGRDTPPRSAQAYLKRLDDYCLLHPQVSVGVVIGRFFAMDRDNRWDRVEKAYNALTGISVPFTASSAIDALEQGYQRDENDEFVQATIIHPQNIIANDDAIIFMNFRADRARELSLALLSAEFTGFTRKIRPKISYYASMTDYGGQFSVAILFTSKVIENGLGEYISACGLRQLRIAETEKYPHVTYFMSGGREEPYALEERILIPSPQVTTYDLQPEMSAKAIADNIVDSVEHDRFDLIICNFANGDMVGHSGILDATIKAVETLDECVGRIAKVVLAKGGELLITADHGNCELMYDHCNNQLHTQHTTNPVPFLYIGQKASIKTGGALKDVAPTLLAMLGLDQPVEMTGKNLITFEK